MLSLIFAPSCAPSLVLHGTRSATPLPAGDKYSGVCGALISPACREWANTRHLINPFGRRNRDRLQSHRKKISINCFGVSCFYCGGAWANFDHFIPFALGGIDHWRNLVPSCVKCNYTKGHREPNTNEISKYEAAMKAYGAMNPLTSDGHHACVRCGKNAQYYRNIGHEGVVCKKCCKPSERRKVGER